MSAWHSITLASLAAADPESVANSLTAASAMRRLSPTQESHASWLGVVRNLKDAARELGSRVPEANRWRVLLEYEIPRRGRRIDSVILSDRVIFTIEWKVGADQVDRAARWQAEQYALDLRDFHEESRERLIVPMLVATEMAPREYEPFDRERLVQPVRCLTPAQLASAIEEACASAGSVDAPEVLLERWDRSPYRPTPSIVEAASMLYEGHDVRELGLAGAENLDATVDAVLDLVELCRRTQRRGIAFITGSPGSGKTLAGLQVVHARMLLEGEAAGVFLSGNMPLVEVISASLTESAVRRGETRQHAHRQSRTLIQHAYLFRDEYAESDRVPPEHVVLFDEAQRAWDREQVTRWTRGRSARSEPQILLDVMNRVPEWAVVVAMVGSGQELNRGEAGLPEWGRALRESHPDWLIRASPAVLAGSEPPPGGLLFDEVTGVHVEADERLHLRMNVRSPRAERLNAWVDSLLDLRLGDARRFFPEAEEYPFVFTRTLDGARAWLRDRADVDHRAGLFASADARRLRAWGLDTRALKQEKAWSHWFLRPRGDVRASDQLEIPASSFDCQGLEVDWGGVCWGNDFVAGPGDTAWRTRKFRGSVWQRASGEHARYILNAYRVILTRARRGQIIWVPRPDGSDPTLDPRDFDAVAELLTAAGVPRID